MDELAYEVTRQKVENHHKVRDFFVPSKNSILYRFKLARKIKSIHTSLDKYFKWAVDLGLEPVAHLGSIVQRREIHKTPPFEDESKIVGRDNDISYLVQTLCKNHEEDLPVVAIVGMGGQGKTTLARVVYNRNAVINMFPKRMWVTVSDDFDFIKILNEMVVSLTSVNSVLENTEGFIKCLQKNLKGERFLLVLDDVWNEKPEEWDNLMNSLIGVNGTKGSSILVTTRNQEVVNTLRCSLSYRVEKLGEEDSWTLFKQRAFSHGGVLETEAFVALGRRMLEKCGGLPLAIKTLGGLLHSKKSEEEWLLIHNSEMWKSKGVRSSLRLSYDNLPYSFLKRCFAYCSIIPKDSHIYKDELVHTWIALGFLLPPKGSNVLMEDVGNEYFNILLWNSLLQDMKRDEYGNIIYCKMHDLVHDLALDVSTRAGQTVGPCGPGRISGGPVHYSGRSWTARKIERAVPGRAALVSTNYSANITPGHGLNQVPKAIYVRLDGFEVVNPNTSKVYFDSIQGLYAQASILSVVLPNFKQLRVLVFNSHYKELPVSMGNIKYLKHLDISNSPRYTRYKLPKSIMRLYNLQTLRVWALNELPEKVCNLINLRHLVVQKRYAEELSTRYMFTGIERLTCLQTLPHFVVSRERNCLVSQLGGLKSLGGTLDLYGLSDVSNMEEARNAKLCEKSNIQCLLLDWSNNEDEREIREYNDEDVMEGLKPHEYLKELSIVSFKGRKFAAWVTTMMNLEKITLKDCNRCDGLPPLGHLPKLREMVIFGMHNVKLIERDFFLAAVVS
ncbi:putative disease resistance protein RGA4 [Apium graveolens]|uniref:putative disease resistance protein RGA4 n=1 Tax=Apium graveolens TaxID=4045 RepID=UPI003D79BB9D